MAAKFITEVKRTHSCGQLTKSEIGQEVVLFGWVHNRRDHGGAVFIDLRDREGLTQVVFEPDTAQEAHDLAGTLRLEFCIGIQGKVASRGANVNPKPAHLFPREWTAHVGVCVAEWVLVSVQQGHALAIHEVVGFAGGTHV